jgi:hypothetical protein
MERVPLTQDYKGYTISGDAQLVHGYGTHWCAAGSVLLIREDKLCIEVHRFQDRLLAYDDEINAIASPPLHHGTILAEGKSRKFL